MRKSIVLVIFLLLTWESYGQNPAFSNEGMQKVRSDVFQKLQESVGKHSLTNEEKRRISTTMGIPLRINLANNQSATFQYLDESSHPVYFTTFNLKAAKATETDALQEGGSLNLGLTGRDMIVGIYDQTRPKSNHNEFGNRVSQLDGSTEEISNHATHVTGTILAAGNNANAKGMATEATGWAFNWDADISKMTQNSYDPELNPGGHLVSNHSYGNLIGWYRDSNQNWSWAGNEGVSSQEDYRFGYYSSKSRQIDELTFAKPYYTIVWAAGNDRSDVGDGSKPSDGPEDTIGPEGVAKNNITVGAVSLLQDYNTPSDVFMSSFSSWGPVDDGRIKPDFVGMGVNVFSSAISNDGNGDSYATLSGTSMASPNVTGTLMLLQELYHQRNSGRYMRSATLKALAIHTTKEAGIDPGPDYMFGWGLLDAKAAADIIINEDGSSKVIRELQLEDNGDYQIEFISNGVDPIKVTIAWTDPAGSPAPVQLNPGNLMLVNDLDMRIVDESGTVYYPWSLNPAQGSGAVATRNGDNYRDNVEQIVIDNPSPQKYTLQVNHKGSLVNGQQDFSMIFSAGVTDGQSSTLYWIGENDDWEDPENWSLTSNGPSAGRIPDEGTRVVIDQPNIGERIQLSTEAKVFSFNVFGDERFILDLNQQNLIVVNGFRSGNQNMEINNGNILLDGVDEKESIVDFGQVTFTEVDLQFNSGRWQVLALPELGTLSINSAEVEFLVDSIFVENLSLLEGADISGSLNTIEFSNQLMVEENAMVTQPLDFLFSGTNGIYEDLQKLQDINLTNNGTNLVILASGDIENLVLSGHTEIESLTTVVNSLVLEPDALLTLQDGSTLSIVEKISHAPNPGGNALINAKGKASLIHDVYTKYCFEGLNVENVDLLGEAVINLDPQSSVVNADNWSNISCEDVIFVNFDVRFNCAGGITEFINLSEGNISTLNWSFAGLGTSNLENPTFVFNFSRTYQVTLEAAGPSGVKAFQRSISVSSNTLDRPIIVVNGSQLSSQLPASSYQWYRNGVPITGATSRSYIAIDEGTYQVAVIDNQCNRISDVVVISGAGDLNPNTKAGYSIGPNPVSDRLSLFINNDFIGELKISLFDVTGKRKLEETFVKQEQAIEYLMDFNLPSGLYLLQIQAGRELLSFKVLRE
ncbi:S8 family serine peptidase [Cyclobacterium marinum]|uniref:Peptidase S8 and S53 subtilisin kexin sedolisin n=1 Tax=Cyclobacterium marinum (strain ATCC 25205 / DSM 745 / LMG 13164 / NCIMB 1802) TaxID=880070 RepID=G0J1E0_CYCMS|nr:S8 family serine peptidase [Cyclobacterium marinum]AEL26579.1 peptidase S8 and S53 subtilisin kexin sedolisin [Cyclobacterium marinum DSM 745]